MHRLLTFFILNYVCDVLQFHNGAENGTAMCIKFVTNIRKSVMKTLAMVAQVFRKKCMSLTCVFKWHARYKSRQTFIDNGVTGSPSAPVPNTTAKIQWLIHEV